MFNSPINKIGPTTTAHDSPRRPSAPSRENEGLSVLWTTKKESGRKVNSFFFPFRANHSHVWLIWKFIGGFGLHGRGTLFLAWNVYRLGFQVKWKPQKAWPRIYPLNLAGKMTSRELHANSVYPLPVIAYTLWARADPTGKTSGVERISSDGGQWRDLEAELEKKCREVASSKPRKFLVATQSQGNLRYIFRFFFFSALTKYPFYD